MLCPSLVDVGSCRVVDNGLGMRPVHEWLPILRGCACQSKVHDQACGMSVEWMPRTAGVSSHPCARDPSRLLPADSHPKAQCPVPSRSLSLPRHLPHLPLHPLDPLLRARKRPSPRPTHALLHPLPHLPPVRPLHPAHPILQLRVPPILRGLPHAGADFTGRRRRERGLGLDERGQEEGLLVQECGLVGAVAGVQVEG